MQQNDVQFNPCRVKGCPALALQASAFRYCAVHEQVATSLDLYDKGLAGKLPALLNQFVKDMDRGLYPHKVW